MSVDTDSHSAAQLGVTLYKPVGGLGARDQQPATRVKFMRNRVLRADWRLVGRVTTAYQCDLTGHPPEEQVVKLGWPEVSGTPETEIFKELGETRVEEAQGHIPGLLASEIPMMMDTRLIRRRLCALPQAHFFESRVPATTVCRELLPVWDLTPDGLLDAWMQAILCMLDSSMSGVYD